MPILLFLLKQKMNIFWLLLLIVKFLLHANV